MFTVRAHAHARVSEQRANRERTKDEQRTNHGKTAKLTQLETVRTPGKVLVKTWGFIRAREPGQCLPFGVLNAKGGWHGGRLVSFAASPRAHARVRNPGAVVHKSLTTDARPHA